MPITPLLLAHALAQTPPAPVQISDRVGAAEVVGLLEERGDTVEIDTDVGGMPFLQAEHEGRRYAVVFYDCDTQKRCTAIQFRAWFHFDRPVSLDVINEWNRTRRHGRAYLDADKDPTLEQNDWLAGGVTWTWLQGRRDWFYKSLVLFEQHLTRALK